MRPPAWTLLLALAFLGTARAKSWYARPLEVHEWGVQVFDLSGRAHDPQLPPFYHTPQDAPKEPATAFSPPVRTLPKDGGERMKPVLYFYTGEDGVPLSVDLGFAWGEPSAWFPQADHRLDDRCFPLPDEGAFRALLEDLGSDRYETRDAASKRLDALPRSLRPRVEKALSGTRDVEVRTRLERWLGACGAPQLRWDHLRLSPACKGELPGKELRADHWVRRAREVDAACVTNGRETERFLFYEGRTAESPAVEVHAGKDGVFRLENRSAHPVHDLILVRASGSRRGLAAVSILEPGKSAEVRVSLEETDGKDWGPRTGDLLVKRLTAGAREPKEERIEGRNPAEPQGPTREAWLYPREAKALAAIWEQDFFGGDGTRLIYREDPSALDEAMPLALYTDMYHYVRLSRVGLVLVRGIGD